MIILGALVLIYSAALIAMYLALNLDAPAIVCLALVGLIFAWCCSINDVSLGRFYRDRLMEAFMPNYGLIDQQSNGGEKKPLATVGEWATDANKLELKELKGVRPIHLINTNLVSWWSNDSRAARRKGDNFVLSALHCGSDLTGWQETENVAKGKVTLATAMATSGAAVNPQGGFAGQGPTTSPAVSFAMALLNLRLGYWLPWNNWRWISFNGNHINPGLHMAARMLLPSCLRKSTNAPGFLELSDGGHFDNLGLYELIRRRCSVIVVCDGGHDPGDSYGALSSLIRRVREDFGADICFDVKFSDNWSMHKFSDEVLNDRDTGPQNVVARPVVDHFPRGTEYAEKGFFMGIIRYGKNPGKEGEDGYRCNRKPEENSNERGLLIYVKSTMIRDLDITTKGYRGHNTLFPFDPTANQFFSPEQFEAYRDLGEKLCKQMIDECGLEKILEKSGKEEMNGYEFDKWLHGKDNDIFSMK